MSTTVQAGSGGGLPAPLPANGRSLSNNSEEIAVEIRGLKKSYGALEAVKGIDLTVKRGEIFGLIGPDGAGKTSTFQILGGVMQQTAGEAMIFGQTARDARSYVGYLTQAFSLYQDLSVSENLHYMGQLRKLSDFEIEKRGRDYLSLFDMDRFMDRLPPFKRRHEAKTSSGVRSDHRTKSLDSG